MVARFASPAVRRAQVPLTEDDVVALEQLAKEDSIRDVLSARALIPPAGPVSESAFLHAVLVAGIKAVRDERDERGYALLADDSEYEKDDYHARRNRHLRRGPRHLADA